MLLDNALAMPAPAAIAAKVIELPRQCVALCGDGAYDEPWSRTAVRIKPHIVVVVLNDSGYGQGSR